MSSIDDITPAEWDELNASVVDSEHKMRYNAAMINQFSKLTHVPDYLKAEHEEMERMLTKADEDALAKQIGGQHYRNCAIQPIEYITANKLGFIEGNIVKYVTRWKDKGGIQDIDKIIHYAELLKKYAEVVK